MADLLFKQNISSSISKAPATAGAAITEKYFEASEVLEDNTSYNEVMNSRFLVAASVTDQVIGMGTVALGKVLILKPSADLGIKLTNGAGESQLIAVKANKLTILHAEFTGLKFTTDTVDVKGQLCIAGD